MIADRMKNRELYFRSNDEIYKALDSESLSVVIKTM